MGKAIKGLGMCAVLAVLASCATVPQNTAFEQTHSKGEQLDIRNILAAHPNKRACVDYQAASNSCASIITSTVDGNVMISKNTSALTIPGTTSVQNVEIVSRSMLQGERACVRAADLSITGRDALASGLLGATRDLIGQFGGAVCGTYFRSGDGYVVTTTGVNGEAFPPGDTKFQFILGDLRLRAQ